MATQLEELRATPVEMLREMRRNPGVYSRALIERVAQEKAQEAPPSQFREDIRGAARGLAPIVRGAERWLAEGRDAMGRREALNKLRLSLPATGPLSYFTAPAPQRQESAAIRSFIDQNSATLINDPAEYEAFVSDPSGYVQMRSRVLTPREKGDRIAPTVEANGAPPAGPAQMAGAEPDAGPESIPAPYLPPLMASVGGLPPGFNGTMAQGDAPPWLRPKAPDGGAVGEGGSTAGGRPVIPTAPVPAQNPAMAAITAGQQAASETVAPAVAAAAAGPEAAGVAEAEGAMSPELRQATQDYLKLVNADGDTDERDRYLSLAKAGFAMASSGSPYLLQAVGQGGNAGIDAYQAARARAAERRLRGAQGTLEVAKIGEDVRRAKSREQLDRERLDVDRTRYASAERRAEKELGIAEQTLAEKKRQFDAGQITEREKIDAERKLREAQADYYGAFAEATRSGARFSGGGGKDPARVREANALVENGVAPDFDTAYKIVRAGTNDMATYQRIVQAEKKALAGQIGNLRLTDAELEELAVRNVERRASGRGMTTPSPAAAAPAGRAPAADPLGLFAQ